MAGTTPGSAGSCRRIVPQSQSLIECLARFLLRRAGFHVESQVNVPGMGHLDLMVDGRLGIETDGAGFHMDRTSFEEDRRRWNVTTRRGIPTLVVTLPAAEGPSRGIHRHGPRSAEQAVCRRLERTRTSSFVALASARHCGPAPDPAPRQPPRTCPVLCRCTTGHVPAVVIPAHVRLFVGYHWTCPLLRRFTTGHVPRWVAAMASAPNCPSPEARRGHVHWWPGVGMGMSVGGG